MINQPVIATAISTVERVFDEKVAEGLRKLLYKAPEVRRILRCFDAYVSTNSETEWSHKNFAKIVQALCYWKARAEQAEARVRELEEAIRMWTTRGRDEEPWDVLEGGE